jgi:hypothetical protein
MLFMVEDGLVDIVRENIYADVLTVRSSERKSLKKFQKYTCAQLVKVPDQYYPWILHIPRENLGLEFGAKFLNNTELIAPITPPATAYFYDFCFENENNEIEVEYGYCWPEELKAIARAIQTREHPPVSKPTFVPLFQVPAALTKSDTTTDSHND